jgi:hypothetical protein
LRASCRRYLIGHTQHGKRLGRGLDHFRTEGAKLVPPPNADDPYEDEVYPLLMLKQQGKLQLKRTDLFDE